MKRFYKMVSVESQKGGAYGISLDGRPVKVPSGKILTTHSRTLAERVMEEWAAQNDEIVPDTMPLTQILTTKIDRVSHDRAAMSAAILKYLDTDLLCYRTENPLALVRKQEDLWDPWLSWFEGKFGTPLKTTTALSALRQDPALSECVSAHIETMDDDVFTVFQLLTALSGSLVLALAFVDQEISPQEVFEAVHVEESYKAEIYNEDFYGAAPAQEKAAAAMKRDLNAAGEYLACVV